MRQTHPRHKYSHGLNEFPVLSHLYLEHYYPSNTVLWKHSYLRRFPHSSEVSSRTANSWLPTHYLVDSVYSVSTHYPQDAPSHQSLSVVYYRSPQTWFEPASVVGKFDRSFINFTFRWLWEMSLLLAKCMMEIMENSEKLPSNCRISSKCFHDSPHILYQNQQRFSHRSQSNIDGAPIDFSDYRHAPHPRLLDYPMSKIIDRILYHIFDFRFYMYCTCTLKRDTALTTRSTGYRQNSNFFVDTSDLYGWQPSPPFCSCPFLHTLVRDHPVENLFHITSVAEIFLLVFVVQRGLHVLLTALHR